MRKRISLAAAAIVLALSADARAADSLVWLNDLDEGKRLAAKQGKDVLINFTGTEWCAGCIALRRDVLDRPEFAAVREWFVPVELEFPQSRDKVLEKPREKYRAWQNEYGIHAFPTLILADAAGKPYAMSQFTRGVKPKEYVERFGNLRGVRTQRDAALAKAAATEGVERARHLDTALSALHKALAEGVSPANGNPLLRFYRPEIDQVLALDAAGAAGLRDKYRRLLDAETERALIDETDAQVDAVAEKEGLGKAIEFIDRKLAGQISPELRRELQQWREVYLEWSDRNEEALAYAKELLCEETLSAKDRGGLRDRMAYNLTRLGRINEALPIWDGLIAEAGDQQDAFRFHRIKAGVLTAACRHNEALDAWVDARRCVEPGTEDWSTAACLHARLMLQMGRFADAEAVHVELLKSDGVNAVDAAIILTDAATELSRAARHKEALEKANQAERRLAGATLRGDDVQAAKWIRSRIETVRREAKTDVKKDAGGQ